jgi:3-oxoacyl-[acyl-carrier protein] reductase
MGDLNGKVAVVTGASKGIGAAIAEELADRGAAVVLDYSRSGEQAESAAARIRQKGGKAKAARADVSRPEEARRLMDTAVNEFGRLDILVNNAGVYEFIPLEGVSEDHFDRLFGLNVKGLLFATQAAVKRFGEDGGSVINISSLASSGAIPATAVYSATKAAVDSFTRTLAAELGPRNIRVNSVLPGPVETEGTHALQGFDQFTAQVVPQTPLRRVGQPQDIATVVAFLASQESGWITGQSIAAGGGLR